MLERSIPLVRPAPVFPEHEELRHPIVVFDIETTGLNGGSLVVGGVARSGPDVILIEQWVAETPEEQQEVAARVVAALHAAGTIVSYNGSEFDLPWLRSRLRAPLPRLPKHLDMLDEARWWKDYGGWRRASLTNVAGFVGLPREDWTTGEEVAALCQRILDGERGAVVDQVQLHNQDDMIQVLHLVPLFFGSPAPTWLPPPARRRWGMLTSRAGFMVNPGAPPTSGQRKWIAELCSRLGLELPTPATKGEAGQEIDRLMTLERIRETLQEASEIAARLVPPEPTPTTAATLEEAQEILHRIRRLRDDPRRRAVSPKQMELLEKMAKVAGEPMPVVRTYAEASAEIDRLKPLQRYGPPSPGQLGYISDLARKCSLPADEVANLPATGIAAGDLIDYLACCLLRADGPEMIATLEGARRAALMYDQPDLMDGRVPASVDPLWVELLTEWEKHEKPFEMKGIAPEVRAVLSAMWRYGGLIHYIQSEAIGEGYRVFRGWRWVLEQTVPPPPSPPDPLPPGQPKRVRMQVYRDHEYHEDGVMLLQCQSDWYSGWMRVVLVGDHRRYGEMQGKRLTARPHPEAGDLTPEVITRLNFAHDRCRIEWVSQERFAALWEEADPNKKRRRRVRKAE